MMRLRQRNLQRIERALAEARRQRAIRPAGHSPGSISTRYAWIEITGNTATGTNDTNGNAIQWTYTAAEQAFGTSHGYGQITAKSGGWTGNAYNLAEDENASGSRQKSTGVDHGGTDYPTTFQMQPIQTGVKVLAELVTIGDTTSAYFSLANGEDGTCE